MKISWLSNAPWAPTGYGNQTKLLVPRLAAAGHELAIIAFYGLEGGALHWNGIPVYPRGFHPYGQDVVSAASTHFGAEIAVSLIDAWVLEPAMHLQGMRWVPWFPIDMEPIPPPVLAKAAQSWQPLVYSRYALGLARAAGLDARYVPHCVDLALHTPGDREIARKLLNLPADKYLVGMVAANKGSPSRKALPQSVAAFAELHRRHPDTALYLHMHKNLAGEMGGVNLKELCDYHGLVEGRDVYYPNQFGLVTGLPDDYLTSVYRALDVLLACSMGEGFGIPILEAQACGCPVITGDWTSMSELTWKGVKVPRDGAEVFWTPLAANQFLPRVGALTAALREAWGRTWKRDRPGDVLAYDADRVVAEHWQPLLAELAARVAAETPAVHPNGAKAEAEKVAV